jgi:hypothetical protein
MDKDGGVSSVAQQQITLVHGDAGARHVPAPLGFGKAGPRVPSHKRADLVGPRRLPLLFRHGSTDTDGGLGPLPLLN